MNKYLVTLYIPILQEKYDVLIPNSKRIIDVINYSLKVIEKLFDTQLNNHEFELVNRENGIVYKNDEIVFNTNIRNGTELIINRVGGRH